MKNIYLNLCLLCLLLLTVTSCSTMVDWEKELDNIKLDQAFVLPVGQADITIGDVLQRVDTIDYLEKSTGSDIYFSITDSADWDFQPVKVLGTTSLIKDSVALSLIPANNGYIDVSIPYEYNLGINTDTTKQRIDTAVINSAVLDMKVSVANLAINPSDVVIKMDFPVNRLKFESGGPSTISFTPGSFGVLYDQSLSSFRYYATKGARSLPVNLNFRIHVGNTPLTPQSKIYFESRFKSMNHRVSYGYYTPDAALLEAILGFAKQIDATDMVDFISDYGSFKLAEPEVDFDVTNYMGVKVNIRFKNMYAYRKNDPGFDTIYATFNGVRTLTETVQPIARYGDNPVLTSFKMNQEPDKGRLDQFFAGNKLPGHFKFEVDIENAKTLAESHIMPDFLTNRHRIQVKNTLRFPLKFNMNSWVDVKDTINNIKLDSLLKEDKIQQAQLVFKITNRMPINCRVTASFLDENDVQLPLDLLESGELNAPQVDNSGKVVAGQTFEPSISYITVDKSQLEDLKKVKKIALNIYMNNADGKRINFQRENSVTIKLGVFLKGNYNPDFNN